MADNEREQTQQTQPKDPDAEPIQIPVPTRDDVMRDLRKVAPPAPKPPKQPSDQKQ